MKIIHQLAELKSILNPIFLTIGNFDGVHLGHQQLLKTLNQQAHQNNASSLIITFENDPKVVLEKCDEKRLICTPQHKLKLLDELKLDYLLLLQFSKDFANQTAEDFLSKIQEKVKISHLILGEDALFGKNRLGTRSEIEKIGKKLNFQVIYLPQLLEDHEPISSTRIRSLIEKGDFIEVKKLLGRNYSIFGKVIKGLQRGKELGFPTANIEVKELCLPPFGVYSTHVEYQIKSDKKKERAVANLGVAPTLREEKTARLEVHLVDKEVDLYGQDLNVIFEGYLREERRFSSIEALKTQIMEEVELVHRQGKTFLKFYKYRNFFLKKFLYFVLLPRLNRFFPYKLN